ncbi:MAG: Fe-S cluster assembly protein SufD [Bacteroidota bacterium]
MSPQESVVPVRALNGVVSLPEHAVLKPLLPELYEEAADLLPEAVFPTTRTEDWKYTRTTRISSQNWKWSEATEYDWKQYLIPDADAHVFVFINGWFVASQSHALSGKGWKASSLKDFNAALQPALENTIGASKRFREDVFELMGITHCQDGIVIDIDEDAAPEKPFHIILVNGGNSTVAQPRVAVRLGRNASAEMWITHSGQSGDASFMNALVDIKQGEGSRLEYCKLQEEADSSFVVCRERIVQDRNSLSNVVTCTLRGGWIRNDLDMILQGESIEANLSGFYAPRKKQHIDNHTLVDHLYPNCNSNELYKGVVFDQGRAVFNGKVFVRYQAQKTNAYQSNANLTMSDDAIVNSKPELEIYADDVKCSHGSTTGQMDEDAVFYLRARGLDEQSARKLLASAFLGDVEEKIGHLALREHVKMRMVEEGVMID